MKIDGHTELQLVPKLLMHVSIIELHKNLVSDTDYGGLKETIDEENNIIISYSTLRSLLTPQLKNVVKIQGHVWLWIFHIYKKYTFLITFMA